MKPATERQNEDLYNRGVKGTNYITREIWECLSCKRPECTGCYRSEYHTKKENEKCLNS